jgi:hypothetical protein
MTTSNVAPHPTRTPYVKLSQDSEELLWPIEALTTVVFLLIVGVEELGSPLVGEGVLVVDLVVRLWFVV